MKIGLDRAAPGTGGHQADPPQQRLPLQVSDATLIETIHFNRAHTYCSPPPLTAPLTDKDVR